MRILGSIYSCSIQFVLLLASAAGKLLRKPPGKVSERVFKHQCSSSILSLNLNWPKKFELMFYQNLKSDHIKLNFVRIIGPGKACDDR